MYSRHKHTVQSTVDTRIQYMSTVATNIQYTVQQIREYSIQHRVKQIQEYPLSLISCQYLNRIVPKFSLPHPKTHTCRRDREWLYCILVSTVHYIVFLYLLYSVLYTCVYCTLYCILVSTVLYAKFCILVSTVLYTVY